MTLFIPGNSYGTVNLKHTDLNQCCPKELSTMMKCFISVLSDVVATSLMWVLSTTKVTVRQETKIFILFHFDLNNHNDCLLDSTGLNQYPDS